MNKNKGFIGIGLILAIVLGIVVVGGGAYYLGKGSPKQEVKSPENVLPNVDNQNLPVVENQKIDTTANQISTKSSSSDITCNDSPNFFIVSKHFSEPGTDILIKYKNSNKNISCVYKVDTTDFEIKNNGDQYFYAINKNILILDSGTGPSNRGIIIYNLDSRKKVFDDIYNPDGVSNLIVDTEKNTMTYWSPNLNQPITKQNCSLSSNSLSRVIVSHILLDLSTLVKKDLGENKCVYQQ